ncbi:MAG: type III PLP-dependent enzyme [Alphaproteobacteria bacterium]|jgi:ornithine decarboxylase|nr:type III PLP-dependent enzyme [Alphaproteobacteria bacterium]
MTEKINRFIAEQDPPTPFLVVDLDIVAARFEEMRRQMPSVEIFYAVKANPAPEIIDLLVERGASFDVASPAEVDLVLCHGADPKTLSYGNTIKKQRDIAHAYNRGVELFAFDSAAELDKLALAAPGAKVFCRLLVENDGAQWPLARKFGCDGAMAVELLAAAGGKGLRPHGLAFHVGSQQCEPEQWDGALARAAEIFKALEGRGVELSMLNIGGGFPARYAREVAQFGDYATAIERAMSRHFGNRLPRTLAEPGRYLVGDAGVLQAEVVLIARKSEKDPLRWIYLDIGRFGGLAETEGEAIDYALRTPHDGKPSGPAVLAGPTCDSVDILYQRDGYEMPLDLAIGDRVQFLSTGAYTTTYATVGFNGFDPLPAYYI